MNVTVPTGYVYVSASSHEPDTFTLLLLKIGYNFVTTRADIEGIKMCQQKLNSPPLYITMSQRESIKNTDRESELP
jgi:hypothetical protein